MCARLRPWQHGRASIWQSIDEQLEIVHVAGQDRFGALHGHDDKVGVDHVAGTRSCEQLADFWPAVEGDDDHGLQESGEACLSGAVAPDLGDDGVRCGEWSFVDECCCEELLRRALSAIDRDEKSCVKNQGRSDHSSQRPLRR